MQEAKAGFIALANDTGERPRLVSLRCPVRGQVLRVLQQSERVLAAGTPILHVGHVSEFEIVSDLLSTEAVKVKVGNPVLIDNWERDRPSGFTKISALGVEEQRVNVVMDFVDDPGRLGDGYRVDIRIIVWEGKDVLAVPSSALFRRAPGWSTFVVENGRARVRDVEVSHRNAVQAEILAGLAARKSFCILGS